MVSAGFAVWAHDDATSNGSELVKVSSVLIIVLREVVEVALREHTISAISAG